MKHKNRDIVVMKYSQWLLIVIMILAVLFELIPMLTYIDPNAIVIDRSESLSPLEHIKVQRITLRNLGHGGYLFRTFLLVGVFLGWGRLGIKRTFDDKGIFASFCFYKYASVAWCEIKKVDYIDDRKLGVTKSSSFNPHEGLAFFYNTEKNYNVRERCIRLDRCCKNYQECLEYIVKKLPPEKFTEEARLNLTNYLIERHVWPNELSDKWSDAVAKIDA